MTEKELEQMLHSAVRYALPAHGYARPRTPDATIRDAYYNSVADAIIRQIKLSWTFERPDVLRKTLRFSRSRTLVTMPPANLVSGTSPNRGHQNLAPVPSRNRPARERRITEGISSGPDRGNQNGSCQVELTTAEFEAIPKRERCFIRRNRVSHPLLRAVPVAAKTGRGRARSPIVPTCSVVKLGRRRPPLSIIRSSAALWSPAADDGSTCVTAFAAAAALVM
jgi:hypothetical protein